MCPGNNAEVSSLYLNGQLRTLYENARHCVDKHHIGGKPSARELEFAMCFAEFYVQNRHDTSMHAFHATFGCPRVDFICNHEVILILDIVKADYDPDYETNLHPGTYETIKDSSVAFRIRFRRHTTERFVCPVIGYDRDYAVGLHILDMDTKDTIVPIKSKNISDTFTHYLKTYYLPTLKSAGHHVLYSLPNFADHVITRHVDYSVVSKQQPDVQMVFGVRIEDINNRYRELQAQAVEYIKNHGISDQTSENSFLAEIHFTTTDTGQDEQMHFSFGPTDIEALCDREIILYLNIQHIRIYSGAHPSILKEQMSKWRIAIILDVIEEIDEVSTKYIQLDVDSARICDHRSTTGNYDDVAKVESVKKNLTGSFLKKVKKITKKISRHIFPKRPPPPTTPRPPIPPLVPNTVDSDPAPLTVNAITEPTTPSPPPYNLIDQKPLVDHRDIQRGVLEHTNTGEFDLITALAQESVNARFKLLWQRASELFDSAKQTSVVDETEIRIGSCLAHCSFMSTNHSDDVLFEANFLAPEIYLISNTNENYSSIIFCLHLSGGTLRPLDDDKSRSVTQSFSYCRLAFEVKLKIAETSHDAKSSNRELTFSLSDARLRPDHSKLPSVAANIQNDLHHYIQQYYFPVFTKAAYHVLFRFPQNFSRNCHQMFTGMRFELASFQTSEGQYNVGCRHNSIVIMGMTGDRSLPQASIARGKHWIFGVDKDITHGTVYLSRKYFLEGMLLRGLERINHQTTIVPVFWGINNSDGLWIFDLLNWDNHRAKNGMGCSWVPSQRMDNNDDLQFVWENNERFLYQNDSINDGISSLVCSTRNVVTIPISRTVIKTCAIKLDGEVKIFLDHKGIGESWSSETSATWSASICLASTASGLEVQIDPDPVLTRYNVSEISQGDPGYETQLQTLRQLEAKLPASIDLTSLVSELKNVMQGEWMGVQVDAFTFYVTRPVFNRRGDLLLELIVHGDVDASNIVSHK